MHHFRKTFFATMLISAVSANAATEISYWLWDTNQLPAYKACAAEFQKQNPDITVKIIQTAWSDYWTGISTGFVSGSAPDVFTDHLARYPEFALNEQLVDLAPMIKQDKPETGIYVGDLFKLWSKEVFPAIRENVDIAKAAFAKKGMDVTPFVEEGTDSKVTFLFPVTDHASDVVRIMRAAIDRIMLSGANPVSTLKSANDEVNALFQ